MSELRLRRFLVESLPGLTWLLERRMTVGWWELGGGWILRVQQHHSGPGPLSVAAVLRGDDDHLGATYRWWPPEDPTRVTRSELVLDDLLRSNAAHRLEKTQRGCMLAGVWWELDEFHGPLEGLILARSERASAADPSVTSWWLGREVTGEAGYGERALAGAPLGPPVRMPPEGRG